MVVAGLGLLVNLLGLLLFGTASHPNPNPKPNPNPNPNPNRNPNPNPKPIPKPSPHQVTSRLVHRLGGEAVAQHWGDFRSTELARFRNGRASYRACPRCAFHNEVQVRGDLCAPG